MNRKSENKHIVDILFVLALFCLFAIYAILLIIVGARVYQKTIDGMNSNYNARTPFSYVTEKIRQSDRKDTFELGKIGDCEALIIHENVADKDYSTYIYAYDGWLKELIMAKDATLSPDAGQNIISVSDFSIQKKSDNLYQITITNADNEEYSFIISTKSIQKGQE